MLWRKEKKGRSNAEERCMNKSVEEEDWRKYVLIDITLIENTHSFRLIQTDYSFLNGIRISDKLFGSQRTVGDIKTQDGRKPGCANYTHSLEIPVFSVSDFRKYIFFANIFLEKKYTQKVLYAIAS